MKSIEVEVNKVFNKFNGLKNNLLMINCTRIVIQTWFYEIENKYLNKDLCNIIKKYIGSSCIVPINHKKNLHVVKQINVKQD